MALFISLVGNKSMFEVVMKISNLQFGVNLVQTRRTSSAYPLELLLSRSAWA